MARNPIRSIKMPIILGVLAVALSIAMMVGWILVIIRNVELSQQVAASNQWLMAAGVLSFMVITAVLSMFSVFLVQEILEGRRQVRFIDSVTHELKSPLASLKLLVQTLDRRELAPAKRADLHQMMLDDLDRLSAFIDDILETSRIGHGPRDTPLTTVSLNEIATRAADRVRQRHSLAAESLTIHVPEDTLLETDPTALAVVLRNLFDNAVKYSDAPPTVRLEAQRVANNRVLMRVVDQGIGIEPDELKRIFDRFYRVSGEAVHRRRGTGIGLYVASALVRNLGGRLVAHSAGLGHGTTLHFSLPAPAPTSPNAA